MNRAVMMALLMSGMLDPMSGGKGVDYEPGYDNPKMTDPNSIQPLHRFVIKGVEVWARNKKDAIKKSKAK